ncbi:hypothetical protein [Flavilitoribacter nigricans]|uniref:Uncharacterized protein n=1 Tax=Flavilitoribacter nigricans (strain ATCC 23147 / DSM 23189 / NBRC 102662 / NCIMB 1420 / SS-2) TaxID=1122177 RepID=A0A2D0NCR6_FLAN2|nr:hypothetical protein [Flavilitoribacter nigricans]PHN06170.1 hypothetical protein CRP01_11335 [Flavilitoribacter nigricans DSM 23189 = NBRC 102662]
MKEILLAIMGSGALMFTLKWAKEIWQARRVRLHPTSAAAEFELGIEQLLEEALSSTNADRVLLLRTTNGGGPIKPGKPIYIEVYREKHTYAVRSVKADFQGVEMDTAYAEMIQQLIREQKISYRTEEMSKGNILHDTYLADRIQESKIRYVWEADNFWFLSFSTVTAFNSHDRHRFEVITRRMRTLFRRKL